MKHRLKKTLRRLREVFAPGTWAMRAFIAAGVAFSIYTMATAPALSWLHILSAFFWGAAVMGEFNSTLFNAFFRYQADLVTVLTYGYERMRDQRDRLQAELDVEREVTLPGFEIH